jgi:DNA-binding FrmR family transcriptional regulator
MKGFFMPSKNTGKSNQKLKAQPLKKTLPTCHEADSEPHPDHQAALARLRKIRGQIEGIERMILDRRYCPEILIQFRAVHSALKAVESPIFEKHLRQCVTDSFQDKNTEDTEKKISELVDLFSRSS